MTAELIAKVKQYLDHKDIPIIAAASAESLNEKAPEGFRPKDVFPDAKSVLIFAKPAPLPTYMTPQTRGIRSFYISCYHTYYRMANEVANTISFMLEEAGYPSLAIPSYSPLKFENGHFNGLISLKHAAQEAGIGKIGKNTLLIHPDPKRGNILRFGGLLTTMEWPVDGPQDFSQLCPEGCTKCIDCCPVGALSKDGIDHLRCMAHCIEHTMLPPHWLMRLMKATCSKRFLDLYGMSFFENYGVSCCECLKQCPHFPGHSQKWEAP